MTIFSDIKKVSLVVDISSIHNQKMSQVAYSYDRDHVYRVAILKKVFLIADPVREITMDYSGLFGLAAIEYQNERPEGVNVNNLPKLQQFILTLYDERLINNFLIHFPNLNIFFK